jgi:cytochrome c-type biogenesis protein
VNSPFAEAILNGSLLLAIPVALLAGLVSFLSPCVLPLVPGYLGYVTGLTGVDLQKQKRAACWRGSACSCWASR